MERELDKALEELLKSMAIGCCKAVKGIIKGIAKLGEKKNLIMFLCCGIVSAIVAYLKSYIFMISFMISVPVYIQYLVYLSLLAVPLIYLFILGSNDQEEREKDKYTKLFEEIGFKGKDGKYPFFLGVKEVDKKMIYTFRSNISLDEWKSNKQKIETALNVNILAFEQENDKKIVKLVTVPADFKIPTWLEWNDDLISKDDGVLRIGESALKTIEFDLNRTPHCLFAGETGSGKSVLLRTCLWQMIRKGAMVFMIDFKGGVEFGIDYEEYGEVITERKRALEVLTKLCEENDKRLKLFRSMKVKNLAEFNKKTGKNLCRIGVFCDEIAEMLDKTGVEKKEKPLYEAIEAKLATLARLSRATGINLLLGVQRPDARILPGQIKNNIPIRASGRFADKTASEIVLGTTDAVNLPEIKGRFLFKLGNEIIQFQSYYFDDDRMLHHVDVVQGGTLTDLKPKESKKTCTEDIKIYNQVGDDIIDDAADFVVSSQKIDLNFDYEAAFPPDYPDDDEEE